MDRLSTVAGLLLVFASQAGATPVYNVSVAVLPSFPGALSPQPLESGTPGLSLSGDGEDQWGTKVSWEATANAASLGAVATVSMPAGGDRRVESKASFRHEVIYASIDDSPIEVVVPVHVDGSMVVGGAGLGTASVGFQVRLDGVLQTPPTPSGSAPPVYRGIALFGGDGSVFVDDFVDLVFTDVPVNVPVELFVELVVDAHVNRLATDSGPASTATSSFGQTLEFADPNRVFILPAGVTANSESMGLVNNSLVPANGVPEPGAVFLLLAGALGLFATGARPRAV